MRTGGSNWALFNSKTVKWSDLTTKKKSSSKWKDHALQNMLTKTIQNGISSWLGRKKSYADFSKFIKIDISAISRIMSGRNKVGLPILKNLYIRMKIKKIIEEDDDIVKSGLMAEELSDQEDKKNELKVNTYEENLREKMRVAIRAWLGKDKRYLDLGGVLMVDSSLIQRVASRTGKVSVSKLEYLFSKMKAKKIIIEINDIKNILP